jgi:hypothetical protein
MLSVYLSDSLSLSLSFFLSDPNCLSFNVSVVGRCRCDGVESGFVKLFVNIESQAILGCTIVAPNAGDMITEVTVCMQYGIGIAQLAGVIHPYPTTQEAIRQCALQYYKYYKDSQGLPMQTLQMKMKEIEEEATTPSSETSK